MVRKLLNTIRERWYFLVLRYFTYLDYNRIARHTAQYETNLKEQAVIASAASERICADSGMCASKNWKSSPEVMQKAEELAWKAQQETKEADIVAYKEMMSKIQTVRDLTPEENARIAAAIEKINSLDSEAYWSTDAKV